MQLPTALVFDPSPINIVLLILAIAGVWGVVELALTLRGVRKNVDTLTNETQDTLRNVVPLVEDVVTKVDGILEDIQPTVESVDPIVSKINASLDDVQVSLKSVNNILGNVESISGIAKGVTGAVNNVATNAAEGVNKLVDKLTGKKPEVDVEALEAGSQAALEGDVAEEDIAPKRPQGYVTYPTDATVEPKHIAQTDSEE